MLIKVTINIQLENLPTYQQYAKFALVAIVETWPVWRGRWTDLCDHFWGIEHVWLYIYIYKMLFLAC